MQKYPYIIRILVILISIIVPSGIALLNGPIGLYVALGEILILFTVVSVIKYRSNDSQIGFLFAGFKLKERDFNSSLAATNIPLVLGLLYFFSLGSSFGVWCVLGLGVAASLPFLQSWLFSDAAGYFAEKRITLHEIVYFICGSHYQSRRSAAIISSLAFGLAIGFELIFGGQILTSILGISSDLSLFVSFIIALITGVYAAAGGQRSVFVTDFLQYAFVLIAIIVVIVIGASGAPGISEQVNWRMTPPAAGPAVAVILGSFIYYPFWYWSSMDTWQRQAVSSNAESARSWQIAGGSLLVAAFVLSGLIGASGVLPKQAGLVGSVVEWTVSDIPLVRAASALIFIGLLSALVSTADTYSVLITQAVDIDILGNDWRTRDDQETLWLQYRRLGTLCIPTLALMFALLVKWLIFADARSLFYVAYAGQSVLYPLVLSAIIKFYFYENNSKKLIPSYSVLSDRRDQVPISIYLGALAAVVLSVFLEPSSSWLYLAPVIALVPTTILIIPGPTYMYKLIIYS